MSKEQQELLNEAYENYKKIHKYAIRTEGDRGETAIQMLEEQLIYTKEVFINKCKTNPELFKGWGLKIEERELSLEERGDLSLKLILNYLNKKKIISNTFEDFKNDEKNIPNIDWRRELNGLIGWIDYGNDRLKEIYDDIKNIPTKLITITYNDKTIKSYEN